jgi:peptidoglycan/LPS O-acetylase OafA/YrhL
MRATAISLVLLHHFLDLVGMLSPWVLNFYGWGLTGVDIFFALSGFLIGGILIKLDSTVVRPGELLRFWARRWLRTLPLYYVMLLVRVLMAFAILSYLNVQWNLWHKVLPYFFFMQSWAWPIHRFFQEAWSLAVEEWFYLLFPLLWVMVICSGVKPFRAFVFASVFMLLAPTIMRLGARSLTPQSWLNEVSIVTVYRFDNIAFGLLGAALSVARPRTWARWRWPGLLFGVGLLWLDRRLMIQGMLHQDNGYFGVWHCSVTGLGSALLLPWCSSVEKLFWQPLQSLVGLISLWSYALYLTHGAFVVSVQLVFASQINQSTVWAWGLLVATACLTFILAGTVHRWIEKPGMALRERWKFTRQEKTAFLHRPTSA